MNSSNCVVMGEACVDLILRPVPLDRPLLDSATHHIEPLRPVTGGIVPNAGIAMARLGTRVTAFCVLGTDAWGNFLSHQLNNEGVDTTAIEICSESATTATAVLIAEDGTHTFAFHAGASQKINRQMCFDRLDLFAQSGVALLGYYHLLPNLEPDLPEVLKAIRGVGCKTALDTANGGGSLQPLDKILPWLDYYIPSFLEGKQQTGCGDPQEMIRAYRQYARSAVLGIKLGADGVLLSPSQETFLEIPAIAPPGPVVDTTGAGDAFLAGLISGLVRELDLPDAARVGAAAGACCVTGRGGSEALCDWDQTVKLLER
ncbi:MAG: hypothetical protein CMJ75_06250 [Planctomycetaceae bacterium]|nr:hypothetical protein [Planctomycetaceae bacterium]